LFLEAFGQDGEQEVLFKEDGYVEQQRPECICPAATDEMACMAQAATVQDALRHAVGECRH
jgi:hypothetical protein